MTATAKPFSHFFAPTMLVLITVLAAMNWYVRPGHVAGSIVALLMVGGMALALLLVPRRLEDESARRHAAASIRSGISFAGSIIVLSLGLKLATVFGTARSVELSWRGIMAILGIFFVFTGNAIPKTLRPLAGLPEDAARVQAFQRFVGWTWVLTGLAFAIAWLVLPIKLAEPLTFILLPGAMLLIAVQVVRLRRAREHTA